MIFQNFIGDEDLLSYLPDGPKLSSIPRDFLLSVLANVKRAKYGQLYSKYKEIKSQRSTVGKKLYQAQITENFKVGLQNFMPINL